MGGQYKLITLNKNLENKYTILKCRTNQLLSDTYIERYFVMATASESTSGWYVCMIDFKLGL